MTQTEIARLLVKEQEMIREDCINYDGAVERNGACIKFIFRFPACVYCAGCDEYKPKSAQQANQPTSP